MTQLFDKVFDMSIGACLVIAAVLIVRLALQHVPRKYCYVLWLVVLFRLLCPVSFQSAFSLFSVTRVPIRLLQGGFGTAPVALEGELEQKNVLSTADAGKAGSDLPEPGEILALVWLLGILALVGYSMVRGIHLRWQLHRAKRILVFVDSNDSDNMLPAWLSQIEVWETEGLETAFIMGVVRPRIYLPAGLELQTQKYILAHEYLHLRRGDPLWRLLGFAALCLHWFNPFVWAAWIVSSRDMEMSCDEAVVRNLGPYAKKGYSAALLSIASGQHGLPGKMLAFGEGETGSRIRNVLNYKKPAFWLTVLTTASIIGLGIFLAADPPGMEDVEAASQKEQKQSGKPKSSASQKSEIGSVETQPSGYGVWQADLTHDGTPETIRFDIKSLQQAGLADLMVLSSDGKVLFLQSFGTSHTVWDTFALYDGADGAYLLEYNPYFGQGAGSYSYRLFSLSDSGEVQVKDEGSVDFSAGMPFNAPDNHVNALVRFTNTVNAYWEKSMLLVTTDQYTVLPNLYNAAGNVVAVPAEENYYVESNTLSSPLHYVEQMGWTDIVLNGKKSTATTSLRSRLKAVNRVLAKQRKIARQQDKE